MLDEILKRIGDNVTIDEIVERWETIGLLTGIEDETLCKCCALKYEEMAQYLISLGDENEDVGFNTFAFPILRGLVGSNDIAKHHKAMMILPKDLMDSFNEYFNDKIKEPNADEEEILISFVNNYF